jgi:murein DD-endopeptidase MepM/ murein hydrolase activator NlpD
LRRKKNSSWPILLLLAALTGGGIYLYNAPIIERDNPVVTIHGKGYWNLKTPLGVRIDDQSGIVRYKVLMKTSGETVELASEEFMEPQKTIQIEVKSPKRLMRLKDEEVTISVEATDASKWNFFAGNSVTETKKFIVDTKRPLLSRISNSYGIRKGGSALVVFRAEDDNMKEFYIDTSFGKRFKPQPFVKEGYYVALIAWPVMEDSFRATLVAEDMAGNITRTSVPLYLKEAQYRERRLKLTENYLEGKIAQLAEDYPETQGVEGRIPQFKIINEDVRQANEKLIHDTTSKVPDEMIDSFSITPFYPLKNGQNLGGFGDFRHYIHNGKEVSIAYHLGVDLASVRQAPILLQNGGEVVYVGYNGIYGNMPIIHHGMGLYTLYAHCSSVNVQEGEQVAPGTVIAKTGTTGSVLGDHLHFGVLVQGIDVRPQEWMDKQWIRLNITDVMESAKQFIERQ